MFTFPLAAEPLISAFSVAFSPRTFQRVVVLMLGAILSLRRRTVTAMLVQFVQFGTATYYCHPFGPWYTPPRLRVARIVLPGLPSRILLDPDPGNNANYYAGGYSIGPPYYRTVVGEYENSESPYGTFDPIGNLDEWNETAWTSAPRVVRGGNYMRAQAI